MKKAIVSFVIPTASCGDIPAFVVGRSCGRATRAGAARPEWALRPGASHGLRARAAAQGKGKAEMPPRTARSSILP
jgi:hypothetical protein